MDTLLSERSLHRQLAKRVEVEEYFKRTGRRLRKKHWLLRHERFTIRPTLKLALRAAGLYAKGRQNAVEPVIRGVTLTFPHLPAAFHGYKILHLSDFHIDGVDGLTEVLEERLSELRPDLCVFTGDYRFEVDGRCDAIYPRMRRVVASIASRHGIYAILGNHDAAEIAHKLEEMGVRMLVNESAELEIGSASIWLAGVDDDFDYQCHDLDAALSAVPRHAFKVLLAHTPELYREAASQNVHVYLCGHTHAGQIRFPRFGSLRHNSHCPKEYSYGYWQHGHMHGYTSPGVGCSGVPVRYNCPPEIVLLQLRRG